MLRYNPLRFKYIRELSHSTCLVSRADIKCHRRDGADPIASHQLDQLANTLRSHDSAYQIQV